MRYLAFIPLLFFMSCSVFHHKSNDAVVLSKNKIVLDGTNWALDSIYGFPSEGLEQSPTLVFEGADNTVHGFGGCNYFNGKYAQNEDDIAFSQLLSTKKYCFKGSKTETKFTAILLNTNKMGLDKKGNLILLQGEKPLAILHSVLVKKED